LRLYKKNYQQVKQFLISIAIDLMAKTIVIGSGIAGIATALRLRAKGHEVHVFESNSYPGGKLTEFELGGYRFDAGPSLFTMPMLVDELFQLFGENPRQYFQYKKLGESCHYFYEDGTHFICPADKDKLSNVLAEQNGENKHKIKAYLEKSAYLYDVTSPVFLENSLHKVSTYTSRNGIKGILNLWKLNMFRSMNRHHERYFKHPRTVQLFNRFATYNGSNPYIAPATLSVIPHLEFGVGTYFPEKGMADISKVLYDLALRQGITFQFNTRVESIISENKKIKGVRTKTGNYYCDNVVSNMDIYHTYDKLLKEHEMPEKVKDRESSSSALIFYWGISESFSQLGLHNIFFSNDYASEFNHIFEKGDMFEDPTVYINITSKHKTEDAPPGHENWFVMVNAPANNGQDWDNLIASTKANILKKLSRHLGKDINQLIQVEDILDPRLIEFKTSSYKGALYGGSSNSRMSAFFRHPNFKSDLEGLYLCGGSVHPGGGIPLCLRSAEIVSKLMV